MDRGNTGDGPEDVETAPDRDSIDLVADDEAPPAPDAEASGDVSSDDDASAAPDGPPAVWLAHVRARAPWLLGPGGASLWQGASAARGPDVVPHGIAPAGPSWEVVDPASRPAPAPEPAVWPEPAPDVPDVAAWNENTAGDAGPSAAAVADGPGAIEAGTPSTDVPRAPERPPVSVPARLLQLETVPRPDVRPGPGPAAAPPIEVRRPAAAPDTGEPALPTPAQMSLPLPDLDPRGPALHRASATWPARPPRPAAPSPVWPPRPHPDGAGLPHPGRMPEPSRPLHRPVTPFVPEPSTSASPTGGPPRPTWTDDRIGWYHVPTPAAHIVNGVALPPWPSLLDDDDDDGDGDEPDGAALVRQYERILRLEREQRRR